MYSKQCKKPQVQKNYSSTLFRVLTALKRVKTDFKPIVLSFLVSLFTSMFLCFFVSWFLCLFGSLVHSFFSFFVSLVSLVSKFL